MRRFVVALSMGFAAQAAQATLFSYDSGFTNTGIQTEIIFTFSTDVTNGFVSSSNGGFTNTFLKLFNDGKQIGTGTFIPMGYAGNVSNNILSIGFSAPTSISYDPPSGGPHYSGKGPPISFNGKVAAVPEPASWALMLGGFGLIGAGMRQRRAKVCFA